MSEANKRQVGGEHYKSSGLQHWDLVVLFNWDYFQGQITKYLMRWRDKRGLEDLQKAAHFMEKYCEEVRIGAIDTASRIPLPHDAWLEALGAVDKHAVMGHEETIDSLAKLKAHVDDVYAALGTEWGGDVFAHIRARANPLLSGHMLVPVGSVLAYKQFTFEGAKDSQEWYRCKACREHFAVPHNDPPTTHKCDLTKTIDVTQLDRAEIVTGRHRDGTDITPGG